MSRWFNMILYQATWIAAVAGAGSGLWWPGVVMCVLFAAWQLPASAWPRADACLVAGIGALGFAIDSVYAQSGLMNFSTPVPWPGLAPVWMTMLWTSYALSLNHSLSFLHGRPFAAAALGAIGAPLAYWAAGSGWHALDFGADPAVTIGITALLWGVLMPGLASLALRLRALDTNAVRHPRASAGARP